MLLIKELYVFELLTVIDQKNAKAKKKNSCVSGHLLKKRREQANPEGRLIVSSTVQQTKKLTFSSAANPQLPVSIAPTVLGVRFELMKSRSLGGHHIYYGKAT
ncbi:hypothetical protein DPMN_044602 [Dreissena polymorpha]|uniref:Uncharacterized protein n=1 Tax=Dreissena polymorpha TaxID=45954 RepID=A0A9D4D3I8_DREPO|nr:hypothetical protein DPMN_044602 [Dreissena polymorpha]